MSSIFFVALTVTVVVSLAILLMDAMADCDLGEQNIVTVVIVSFLAVAVLGTIEVTVIIVTKFLNFSLTVFKSKYRVKRFRIVTVK